MKINKKDSNRGLASIFLTLIFLGVANLILPALFSSAWSAPLGPVLQETSCGGTGATSSANIIINGITTSCEFSSTPSFQDVLVVGVVSQNDTQLNIADTYGNSWTRLISSYSTVNGISLNINVWATTNTGVSGPDTVTISSPVACLPSGHCPAIMDLVELQSGFSAVAVQYNSTNGVSNAFTPTIPNELNAPPTFVYSITAVGSSITGKNYIGNSGSNYDYTAGGGYIAMSGTYEGSGSNRIIANTYSGAKLGMLAGFTAQTTVSNLTGDYWVTDSYPDPIAFNSVSVVIQGPQVQLTTTGVSTVGANLAGQTQKNTYGPVAPFDIGNISTYTAAQFQEQWVYIWYNSAPYPVTITNLWIPVITTGDNGSNFIVGIYTTHDLTHLFQLQWSQTINLQTFENYQNFSYSPNIVVAANSFYSIGMADINVTLVKLCQSDPAAVINTVNCYAGNNLYAPFTSPAAFYGVNTFDGGYVGAVFLNQNVSSPNPESVLPSFYTDNVIVEQGAASPAFLLPAMYITETDTYIHVDDVTTTSYIIISDYQAAINRFFNSTAALEGLFVVILPLMILVVKVQNPIIVFAFFLVTMFLAGPTGLNIIPFWGLFEILLVFFVVLGRE